jgi:uncharacterized membrane protein/thiol-disulfide isomerase/thioredoxin
MESRIHSRNKLKSIIISVVVLVLAVFYPILPAHAKNLPVVNAVLFYSPTCAHCHYVITEVLPPLFEQYQGQLNIIGVDVTQEDGRALFIAALQYFKMESSGVPLLVLDDNYLMGSVDIPQKLPGLIEQYLAQGGLDWPDIPGVRDTLANIQNTSSSSPSLSILNPALAKSGEILANSSELNLMDRLALDPAGNSVAILVLIGMLLAVIGGIFYFQRSTAAGGKNFAGWLFPVFCMAGMVVALYLSYVEITQVEAVCGPVGDCNTVQQSVYARLFGVLPIGVLGLLGYGLILLAWLVRRYANRRMAAYASVLILGMCALGLLFSIYLTFLEPFVIGASCAWCLASAIIMTALFWLSLLPGKSGLTFLYYGEKNVNRRKSSRRAIKSL